MTDLPPWAQALIECERRVLGPTEEQRERALFALIRILACATADPHRREAASSHDGASVQSTMRMGRTSRPD